MKTQYCIDRFTLPASELSVAFYFAIVLFTACSLQPSNGIATPILISPGDGSTITQNPPSFVWHRVEDAVEYNMQVADGSFSSVHTLVIELACYPDTSYSPSGAMNTGIYYWRAQALAGG